MCKQNRRKKKTRQEKEKRTIEIINDKLDTRVHVQTIPRKISYKIYISTYMTKQKQQNNIKNDYNYEGIYADSYLIYV